MVIKKEKGNEFADFIELTAEEQWFSSNLQPIIDERGIPKGVQIISVDNTKPKRAEEAMIWSSFCAFG